MTTISRELRAQRAPKNKFKPIEKLKQISTLRDWFRQELMIGFILDTLYGDKRIVNYSVSTTKFGVCCAEFLL